MISFEPRVAKAQTGQTLGGFAVIIPFFNVYVIFFHAIMCFFLSSFFSRVLAIKFSQDKQ